MEDGSGYMVARFIGNGKAEVALHHFEEIAEECKRTNKKKLLIDCTKSKADGSLVDMYEQGEGAKLFTRLGIKVAVAVPEEKLEAEKFAELVARNRGVDACVFTDYHKAEKWLLK